MLERHAWTAVRVSCGLAVLVTVFIFLLSYLFGVLALEFIQSYAVLTSTLMSVVTLSAFLVLFFAKAAPLFRAHRIITQEALPESLRPKIERPERPWRERTPLRHLEFLKGQLLAAEERLAELATVEAYCRYYQNLADENPDDHATKLSALVLQKAWDDLGNHCVGDKQLVAELIERIDLIFAGQGAAEIRMIEEAIDELRHQRGQIAPQCVGTLHKTDMAIRACERDISELNKWQSSQQKTIVELSPQREKFNHAKTVEYDNERIQIWTRYAKFKAYEEQLAMKKDEQNKIHSRVKQGELTESEAAYLLQKLDEYIGEEDGRIFA